jgi:hypothetical protein
MKTANLTLNPSPKERDFYPPSPWEKGPGVEVRKAVFDSLPNKIPYPKLLRIFSFPEKIQTIMGKKLTMSEYS